MHHGVHSSVAWYLLHRRGYIRAVSPGSYVERRSLSREKTSERRSRSTEVVDWPTNGRKRRPTCPIVIVAICFHFLQPNGRGCFYLTSVQSACHSNAFSTHRRPQWLVHPAPSPPHHRCNINLPFSSAPRPPTPFTSSPSPRSAMSKLLHGQSRRDA
jgi:hypothetical protein